MEYVRSELVNDPSYQARLFLCWSVDVNVVLERKRSESRSLKVKFRYYTNNINAGRVVRYKTPEGRAIVGPIYLEILEKQIRNVSVTLFLTLEHRKLLYKLVDEYLTRRRNGIVFPLVVQLLLSSEVLAEANAMLQDDFAFM